MRIYFIIVCIVFAHATIAQTIDFDVDGRVTDMTGTETIATGQKIRINLTPLRDKIQKDVKDRFIDSLRNWFNQTLTNIKVGSGYTYRTFNENFWPSGVADDLEDDVRKIHEYLQDSSKKSAPKYLEAVYRQIKKLYETPADKWYVINSALVNSGDYTFINSDYDAAAKSYKLELKIKHLVNQMIADLFNETYSDAKLDDFRALGSAKIAADKKQLENILAEITKLGKHDIYSMTDDIEQQMTDIVGVWQKIITVQAIQQSNHLRNWIWWKQGEPVITPFDNVDEANKISKTDENLNQVLLKQSASGKRDVTIYIKTDDVTKKTDNLKKPLQEHEEVVVSIHNVPAGEKAELRLTKETPHNGWNQTVTGIDEALNLLLDTYNAVNGINPLLQSGLDAIGKLTQKSLADDSIDSLTNVKTAIATATTADQFWAALEKDLKEKKLFNKYLFDKNKSQKNNALQRLMKPKDTKALEKFAIDFINEYDDSLNIYASARKNLSVDSSVVAVLLRLLPANNRPPSKIAIVADPNPFAFRTAIRNTGTSDKNADFEYAVMLYRKKDDKTDSTTLSSFKYKNGKRQRISASVGVVYTFANEYFAHNSVAAGDPITITSSSDRVSFTFGLHIYFSKIYTLDDAFVHSEICPWYQRLSLYAGLGIPKVFKNFYPGISYDLVPGIRLIGGAHLYVHERYKLVNNIVDKQTSRLRHAGPFLSFNIYPLTILKNLKPKS